MPIMVPSLQPPVTGPHRPPQKRIRGPLVTPDDPRHGTMNGYKNHRCRCEPCRTACADFSRNWRATHRPANRPTLFDRQAFCREAAASATDACIDMPLQANGKRPVASLNGRTHTAARVVWILVNGDPGPWDVAHLCDRGRQGCVNPRHLYLATREQNIRDGHESRLFAYGEEHPSAKLTDATAREALRLVQEGRSQREVARIYGVGPNTISALVQRRTWKHLDAA